MAARVTAVRPTQLGARLSGVDCAAKRVGTKPLKRFELLQVGVIRSKSVAPTPGKERHVSVGTLLSASLREIGAVLVTTAGSVNICEEVGCRCITSGSLY